MSNDTLTTRTMLNSLTSLRFFAVLFVFIFHVGILSKYQTGYVGVSFFFILSGFILTYNYQSKFEKKLDIYQIKKFYIARIAKIYPIHIITFFLAVPYYFFIPLKHEPILYVFQAITNIALIHSFIPFGNISFNGVSWSLSNELFFYLLFPLLLLTLLKYFKKIKWMIAVSISLWLLVSSLFFFLLPQNDSFTTWLSYYFPGVRVLEFIIGIVLGLIYLNIRQKVSQLPIYIFNILEVFSILFLIIMVILSPNFIQNLRFGLVFIPCLSSIIFIYAFQKGILSKILSQKIFVYLGEVSFSFYMIHNLVLSYIYFLWKPDIPLILLIIVCFILSICLSSILYHFFEEPMRIKLRLYLNTKLEERQKVRSNDKKITSSTIY